MESLILSNNIICKENDTTILIMPADSTCGQQIKLMDNKNINVYQKLIQLMLKCYEDNFRSIFTLSAADCPTVKQHFQCEHCKGDFKTKLEILNHLVTCESRLIEQEIYASDNFLCVKCREEFDAEEALSYHLRSCQIIYDESVSALQNYFKCQHCGSEHRTKIAILTHLNVCESRIAELKETVFNNYLCAKCSEEFDSEEILTYHLEICRINEEPQSKFAECDNYFQTDNELKNHLMICENPSSFKKCTSLTPFTCKICGTSFKAAEYLRDHILRHSNNKYNCTKCNKKYKARSNLIRHLKSHDPTHTLFVCDHCGKSFIQSHKFNEHLGSHARGILHRCKVCKKPHDNAEALADHMNKHSSVKQYKCNLCSKVFLKKRLFQSHMRFHLKPFACGACDKSFNERSHLVKHFKNIHAKSESKFCDESVLNSLPEEYISKV